MTAQTATDANKIPFHGGKSTPSGDGLIARTSLVTKFWEITPSASATDDPTPFVTTWEVAAGDRSLLQSLPVQTLPLTLTVQI